MTLPVVLLRKELVESWRTMRLGALLLAYVAFGIASPVLARYTPELLRALLPAGQLPLTLPAPTAADAIAQYVKNVGGTLTLGAILAAAAMVAPEKERGTAAFLFARGIGPGPFVLAKLQALGMVLGAAVAASGLVAFAYTAWLFPAPDGGGFAELVVLIWFSQLTAAAITLLGGALARSAVAAGAFGLGAYLLLAIVSAFPTVGAWTPAGLQGIGASIAIGGGADDLAGSLVANLILIGGSVIAAWLVLRRQER